MKKECVKDRFKLRKEENADIYNVRNPFYRTVSLEIIDTDDNSVCGYIYGNIMNTKNIRKDIENSINDSFCYFDEKSQYLSRLWLSYASDYIFTRLQGNGFVIGSLTLKKDYIEDNIYTEILNILQDEVKKVLNRRISYVVYTPYMTDFDDEHVEFYSDKLMDKVSKILYKNDFFSYTNYDDIKLYIRSYILDNNEMKTLVLKTVSEYVTLYVNNIDNILNSSLNGNIINVLYESEINDNKILNLDDYRQLRN